MRPYHSDALAQDELWRYAADFKTNAGRQLGVKLTRRAPGVGELEVYFDPAVAMGEKTGESPKSETNPKLETREERLWCDGFGIRISGVAFPVLLVIRNAEGEVRWMEVRDWLKRASDNGRKPVNQIVFAGARFDVMSVRRWREKVLGGR